MHITVSITPCYTRTRFKPKFRNEKQNEYQRIPRRIQKKGSTAESPKHSKTNTTSTK